MQALAWSATLARLTALAAAPALFGLLGVGPAVDGSGLGVRGRRFPGVSLRRASRPSPRAYEDWPVTLVDTILRVPKTYVPPDLVRVVDLGVVGRGRSGRSWPRT